MRKIIKCFVFILALITSFSFVGMAFADEYRSISSNYSVTKNSVSFSDVRFSNWSDTSTKNFGLSGSILNNNNFQVNVNTTVYYYDKNKKEIAKTTKDNIISAKEFISYNQMSNLDVLGSYSANDIKYYKLEFSVTKYIESTDNIKPSQNSLYMSDDYVIDSYYVNIKVNEDNSYDVTEEITAYFNTAKHGIIRVIPLKNEVARVDGSITNNRAKISNLNVSDAYTTSRENNNYNIKIGSVSTTLTGEKKYTISYNYNIGKDKMKDYDEFYYNIIGTKWDTVIGGVTFKITMPKEFDASKLGFSVGKYGSTDSTKINYNVDGNVINGSYDGVLGAYEPLTIRLALDEGYFIEASNLNLFIILAFLIPIIFIIIALYLWYKHGKDEKSVPTVEFYPPEGYNSLEIAFLYKEKANDKDVISLLIYLANKGYIKIEEAPDSKKSIFIKESSKIVLTKLKEYEGDNECERIFLDGIFGKDASVGNQKKLSSLEEKFYKTINLILSKINKKGNKNKIFEKASSKINILLILMTIVVFVLTIAIPFSDVAGIEMLMVLIFPAIGIPVIISMLASSSSVYTKIFAVVWGLGFVGIPLITMFVSYFLEVEEYTLLSVYGIICIIILIVIISLMPKRNKYGIEILGKIQGFKNFLETAEKNQLEAQVLSNPSYFYDILPYTYVLGVSDKWIKKFETIATEPPTWYDSPSGFNYINFETFMHTTMVSALTTMTSAPAPSSSGLSGGGFSGGSSGGGFSGGGSGGGGGSSW